jgi:PAS domain-containing protein
MESRILGANPFVVRVAVRAVLIGALACGALQLLLTTHLYATALVIIGLASVVIADLRKIVGNADHTVERSLESLTAEAGDMPLLRVSARAQRAATLLQIERAERQQHLDYQQTLLDTVAAALIIVHPDNRVTLANRAARSLAASSVGKLEEIAAIGTSGAQQLLAIAPGRRQIVSMADGRAMFVSVSQFSIPGRLPQRLISLQRIAGELDAIELKAWQDVAHVLAHEMMNSLTPISSLSESLEFLLQTSGPRDEIAGALEAIRRRSLGLMDFVERYRKLAELPTPEPQRIRAHEFLSGIDRLMSGTFREKRHDQPAAQCRRGSCRPGAAVYRRVLSIVRREVGHRNCRQRRRDSRRKARSGFCAVLHDEAGRVRHWTQHCAPNRLGARWATRCVGQ